MAKTQFNETGTQGLEIIQGYIYEAYNTKLMWPTCYDDYNRIRRSDPEMAMVRNGFTTMSRMVTLDCESPDDANDDEKAYQEFCRQVLDDIIGGPAALLEAIVNYVPFLGWAWWSVVPGLRRENWSKDGWRSKYNDGLIGIRKLAWRDHSSFYKWDIDTDTAALRGMIQRDPPRPAIGLPLGESLHLTFGDPYNPEGLALLEAIWRLERIKCGYEIVHGIGSEHAAGYLDVTATKKLKADDHTNIQKAARHILSAQEGNYAAWPEGVTGAVKDIPFSAAGDILEAIRYYGIMKLQVFAMEFTSVATTAGTGAYAARSDSREGAIDSFNGMLQGFAQQIDNQIGKRLYEWNKEAFPGVVNRPRIVATPVEKTIALDQLGSFLQAISPIVPMDDDDLIAIRRKSRFLPETLPETDEVEGEPSAPIDDQTEETAANAVDDADNAELARRPFAVSDDEQATTSTHEWDITEGDINRAVRKFGNWAKQNDPELWGLMNAEIREDENGET